MVIIIISHEPGVSGWLPCWRAGAPGCSVTEPSVGAWPFLRLLSAVAQALRYWDRAGRPPSAFC